MIYVIKTENDDVIVFDSITSFAENYNGSVTSHPVEDGTKISDHVIVENVKLKIQGVVTDYNFFNPLKDVAAVKVPAYAVDNGSKLNYLTSPASEQVVPDNYAFTEGGKSFSAVASANAVKAKLIEIHQNKIPITVLEYDFEGKDSIINTFTPCIITDIDFTTTPDSGYAFYPSISIEKIKVAPVKITEASSPKITQQAVKDAAADPVNKGNQPGGGGAKDSGKPNEKLEDIHKPDMDALSLQLYKNNCSRQYNKWSVTSPRPAYPQCVLEIQSIPGEKDWTPYL